MKITAYRYPQEQWILALTLGVVFLIIALTATATLCTSVIFIAAFVMLSYYLGRTHHLNLLKQSTRLTSHNAPRLANLIKRAAERISPGEVEVYLTPGEALNAYTFGIFPPKVIVLYSPLLEVMDEEELLFVIGHEMGHIALGHTWLNSLVGGLAGIPSSWSAAAVLSMAFLWWNRACEYSADRAGLLASGKPEKAITALIKLGVGSPLYSAADLERAYRLIDAEDDTLLGSMSEVLRSHPLLIRRIEKLRNYMRSAQYQRLMAQLSHLP